MICETCKQKQPDVVVRIFMPDGDLPKHKTKYHKVLRFKSKKKPAA